MSESEAMRRFKHGQRLYELRIGLFRAVAAMDEETLARAAAVVEKLTPDELRAALGYAEGLAAWSWVGQESEDATLAQPDSQATGTGSGRAG